MVRGSPPPSANRCAAAPWSYPNERASRHHVEAGRVVGLRGLVESASKSLFFSKFFFAPRISTDPPKFLEITNEIQVCPNIETHCVKLWAMPSQRPYVHSETTRSRSTIQAHMA